MGSPLTCAYIPQMLSDSEPTLPSALLQFATVAEHCVPRTCATRLPNGTNAFSQAFGCAGFQGQASQLLAKTSPSTQRLASLADHLTFSTHAQPNSTWLEGGLRATDVFRVSVLLPRPVVWNASSNQANLPRVCDADQQFSVAWRAKLFRATVSRAV